MKMRLHVLGILALCAFVCLPVVAEDAYFDSDGVKIRYIVEGEGEPIVLIHGFSANIDFNWRSPGVIDALDDEYRVIALDNRGHGKSDKPHGGQNYGKKMTQDVINLLDHLEIGRAHVMGYSMGGFITLNLLTNHPDRVITAVVGGAGWTPADAPNADFADTIAESLENGDGFAPLFELLTPEGQEPPSKEELEMTNKMLSSTNDVLALAGAMRGMKNLAVTEKELLVNEVPTLVIVGGIDPLKVSADGLHEAMPNTEKVVIDGADHMTALGNPDFVSAVEAFLAEHSGAPAGAISTGK